MNVQFILSAISDNSGHSYRRRADRPPAGGLEHTHFGLGSRSDPIFAIPARCVINIPFMNAGNDLQRAGREHVSELVSKTNGSLYG